MARTNFKFEKRQKELARQKKAEEKRLRKLGKLDETADSDLSESETEKKVSDADEVAKWLSE